MSEHRYTKEDLIKRFEGVLGKKFGEIDRKGMFDNVQEFRLQKGIAGAVVEQCVLGYDADNKQAADLIIEDGDEVIEMELKTTGMVTDDIPRRHYVAKEPMSITAVGVYDIADQTFADSHFWNKLEHMLVVYYHYDSNSKVTPYEYRDFQIKGYEFHEFDDDEQETFRQDWEYVHAFVADIIANYPGPKTKEWKDKVKEQYIDTHSQLRRVLSYIDLAPKFPPRFRLKKSVVTNMISKHFGYELEQLPGKYITVSDVDKKCHELAAVYKGKTVGELADLFGIPKITSEGKENKGISEQVALKMFGCEAKKLNQVELFQKFGLIAKTVTLTSRSGYTEDMKLFHIDFNEMMQEEYIEEDENVRAFTFEDSELYTYFVEHAFLCILFQEQEIESSRESVQNNLLINNTFVGFKRIVFPDAFIENTVKPLWIHTRNLIKKNELKDVVTIYKGKPKINKNGEVRSAPNFLKSKENDVFVRGSGNDSSSKNKKECVNGIKMLPQYIWIKGSAIVGELKEVEEL